MQTAANATSSTTIFSPSSELEKLWDAAANGDSLMIRLLAAQGIDLDARNTDGMTAFALATQHSHADAAMTILAARDAQYMKKLGAALGGASEEMPKHKTA